MSADPQNQAEPAPHPKPAEGLPAARRIELLTACRFAFTQRDWLKNAVLVSVLMLIPVLNQLVIYGYSYEITELLHRRQGGPYPLVDYKRFAAYATRGVWPFIVALMVQTGVVPFVVVLLDGTMVGSMAAIGANQSLGMIIAAVLVPLAMVAFFTLILSMAVALTPFLLRGGLSQDFAHTFHFRWTKDFLRKMWLETILVNLFVMLASLVLMPLGCLACGYGMLLVAVLFSIVGAHLNWQLYELYLARGGEPIPLKPLPADVPPVVHESH